MLFLNLLMRFTRLVAVFLTTWVSSSLKQSHHLVYEILLLHLLTQIRAPQKADRMVENFSVSGWRRVLGCSTTSADIVCVLRVSWTLTEFSHR